MTLAQRFRALFSGMEKGYGTYNNINQTQEDGKRTGDPLTKRQPVTDDLYQQHLDGKNGLGIIPIREDNTCVFGAIDVDVYDDLDPANVAALLSRLNLPLIPCRSKSGGVHIYLFCKTPVPASKMQDRLRDIGARMGYGNSEIFPKQTKTTEKDLGSWINLPYFGSDATNRYGVKLNGDPYTLEEFIEAANTAKVDVEFFDERTSPGKSKEESKGKTALPDGPPCLQHLVELGFPEGTRNAGLFALGVYFRKSHPIDWKEQMEDANRKLFAAPLPASEVGPIIGSLDKKEYFYACSKHPLAPHCNAVVCRSRKYGVSGGSSSFPVLGQIRKLLTAPPVWFLDVTDKNGHVLSVEMSTDDLQDPNAFQKKCIERLNIMPQMPSRVVWQHTINRLLENVYELDPPPADASTEGMFWDLLEQFCTGRTQAQSEDEILLGKPWTADGRTFFRTSDLLNFLTRKGFKEYKVQQLAKVLKMRKSVDGKDLCGHEVKRIGSKTVNLWSVPEFARRSDDFPVSDAINDKEKF